MSENTFSPIATPIPDSAVSSISAPPPDSTTTIELWWEFVVAVEVPCGNGEQQPVDQDQLATIAANLVELGAYGVVEGEVRGSDGVPGAQPYSVFNQNSGQDLNPDSHTHLLTAYFCSQDQSTVERVIAEAGCRTIRVRRLNNSDWLTQIRYQFPPITILGIKIIPVLTEEEADLVQTAKAANAPDREAGITSCVLIPGCGFGSGHHPTTHALIELLQDPRVKNLAPRRILDFGCGSGVLTIAAAKIYPANIVAIDNDQFAIDNTLVNLRINGLSDRVMVQEHLHQASGEFDLILANIYLEVLDAHAGLLSQLARNEGVVLVSGIRPEEAPKLLSRLKKEFLILEKYLVISDGERLEGEGTLVTTDTMRLPLEQPDLKHGWWSGLFRRVAA